MMENTDYNEVVNDPTDTPYMHSLMSAGTTMANYHAVYHPSDENYLAIAGGETYATGATYFPNINDPRANLGDALETAGKSWKAYEQGMGTPCNTTHAVRLRIRARRRAVLQLHRHQRQRRPLRGAPVRHHAS